MDSVTSFRPINFGEWQRDTSGEIASPRWRQARLVMDASLSRSDGKQLCDIESVAIPEAVQNIGGQRAPLTCGPGVLHGGRRVAESEPPGGRDRAFAAKFDLRDHDAVSAVAPGA